MRKHKAEPVGTVGKSIKRIRPHHWAATAAFVLIAFALGFLASEGYSRTTALFANIDSLSGQIEDLSSQLLSLESGFASTTALLEGNIEDTQSSFASALEKEKENVSAIESRFGSFQKEVGEISGTVSTLEKLSKTDPELLQKYSKVFFLNEHYEPPRLLKISEEYTYSDQQDHLIHDNVWPNLRDLLAQAKQEEVKLFVFSAFRSFNTQESLKSKYTVLYGAGTANQFSADQGYSEHQLGTTVDFITTGINGTLEDFETTEAYTWLSQNAHEYGFILSYPEGNDFYIFEPWHWRFVGVDFAIDLRNTGKHFYDLDQREIDTYLVSVFE